MLLAALALAGCASSPGADMESPAASQTLEWRGHLSAGAAADAWAHMAPFADAGRAAWNVSFHVDVREPPDSLEVQLDWEATAARLQVMVVGPGADPPWFLEPRNAERPETVNEYADQPPICMRVPPGEIVDGPWAVMAHAEAAVDVELRFTVRAEGGALAIVDQSHTFGLDDEGRFPPPDACATGVSA